MPVLEGTQVRPLAAMKSWTCWAVRALASKNMPSLMMLPGSNCDTSATSCRSGTGMPTGVAVDVGHGVVVPTTPASAQTASTRTRTLRSARAARDRLGRGPWGW